MKTWCPKYLAGRTPPPAAVRAICCPLCGAILERMPSGGLGCPRHLHGKLMTPVAVAAVIKASWPLLGRRRLRNPWLVIRRLLAVLSEASESEVGDERETLDRA